MERVAEVMDMEATQSNFLPCDPGVRLNRCSICRVRQWALCQPLPDADLCVVENFKSGERKVASGADVYTEGEPWHELYTLLDGWILLYKLLDDGRRQITKVVLPGDFIGFVPDLNGPMDHSAAALTDVQLCVFPRTKIFELFKAHPELAIRMTWLVARDVEMAQERLISVGRRTAEERVSHFLLELYYRLRFRSPEPQGTKIPLPLTQEHIGDALGLTAVHVNRTIRKLREAGMLAIEKQSLKILDPDSLAEMAKVEDETLQRLNVSLSGTKS